ncbi:uncharacterized protein LOC108682002 [Hyalella azteca]|uniref:Uncharacterized protein LOC108682002 n=1 Tax=Hyalella azteca TaxID=294128 RepID=A0A8B7PK76_HYAAZ|nr:uncharacterized protein LOC108682002 [Hyalella azteca]
MIFILFGTAVGCAISSLVSAETTAAANTFISTAGANITFQCHSSQLQLQTNQSVYWTWPGVLEGKQLPILSPDGSLHIPFVTLNSSGNYSCFNEADDSLIVKHSLLIPGPPPPPANLTVSETDDVIILHWHNPFSPMYLTAAPDTVLHLRYRPVLHPVLPLQHDHAAPLDQDYNAASDAWSSALGVDVWSGANSAELNSTAAKWKVLPHALPANQVLVAVEQRGEESYQFEMWAENSYGSSPHVAVTTTINHPSHAFTKAGAWERSRGWLVGVIIVLISCNLAALVWIFHHSALAKKKRRRQRAIANHSGLSGECEHLELVCHAHDIHSEAVNLTLPHHAALV